MASGPVQGHPGPAPEFGPPRALVTLTKAFLSQLRGEFRHDVGGCVLTTLDVIVEYSAKCLLVLPNDKGDSDCGKE